jgi:hypothetical protein
VSHRFNILRAFLRNTAAIQPDASNGNSPLTEASRADAVNADPPPAEVIAAAMTKMSPGQIVLIVLGTLAFLYFVRPVILPIFLACVAGMTLKPLIRWLSWCHIPPALSAAVVICLLMSGLAIGFFHLSRPALTWMNEAPQHMTELRQRVQKIFPRITRFNKAAAAVNSLGATEDEQEKATVVEVKTSRVPSTFINWTGTFLAGVGETLVLLYLLLASGDFLAGSFVQATSATVHTTQSIVACVTRRPCIGRRASPPGWPTTPPCPWIGRFWKIARPRRKSPNRP